MLTFLELMVALLQGLKWALIMLFVFWVLPAMIIHACEEFSKKQSVPAYQGRHWRDPQDYKKKMYVVGFVNRRRDEQGGIRGHRRTT